MATRFIREAPGAPAGVRPRLAVATLILAAASAIAMAVLYHPSFDPSRVYDGTDTRAFELLAGAALAMVWPSRKLTPKIAAGARRILDGAGAVGLLVIALMIWRTNQYSSFIYDGGLVLLSIATVLVVAALAHPASRLGVLLGWAPLRWIGVRSYGIYLWHFPIIVLTSPSGPHGSNLLRDALQVGATFGIAALSWHFVEEPVRHGALGRLWKRLRAPGLAAGAGLAAGLGSGRDAHRGAARRAGRPCRRRARSQRRTAGDLGQRRRLGGPDRADFAADDRGQRSGDSGAQLLQVGGPHRRLDLRGADLDQLPAEPQ